MDGQRIYMVSDLGASFGIGGTQLASRRRAKTIWSLIEGEIHPPGDRDHRGFRRPRAADFVYVVNPQRILVRRIHLEWIGKNIPREDARWMGHLLARLSPQQIRDAFRAAGYAPEDADEFAGCDGADGFRYLRDL